MYIPTSEANNTTELYMATTITEYCRPVPLIKAMSVHIECHFYRHVKHFNCLHYDIIMIASSCVYVCMVHISITIAGLLKTCTKVYSRSPEPRIFPDGWVIIALGDPVTSVLPLGRHASTSPILSQRYPSINYCY